MVNPMLALALLASLAAPSVDQGVVGSIAEGEAWLAKVEKRLYAWSRPGSIVRFSVRTDVLEKTAALVEQELAKRPDLEGARALRALRQAVIRGSIDTETGAVSAEVEIPYDGADARRKAALDQVRRGIVTMVEKSLGTLPLHDTGMLGNEATVQDCQVRGEEALVAVVGKRPGQHGTIHVNTRSLLPETIEMAAFTVRYRFSEITPGRFVPSRLEVHPKSGSVSRTDYTWQKVSDLYFPSSVRVTSGPTIATVTFESLSLAPRPR